MSIQIPSRPSFEAFQASLNQAVTADSDGGETVTAQEMKDALQPILEDDEFVDSSVDMTRLTGVLCGTESELKTHLSPEAQKVALDTLDQLDPIYGPFPDV